MDETVYIGLVVTSQNAGRAATARIAHVTSTGDVSPAGPFTVSEDIGLLPTAPASGESRESAATDSNDLRARLIGGELRPDEVAALSIRHGISVGSIKYQEATKTYTIIGAGTDIWSKSDEFHYAHKRLTGEGAIAARIDSVEHVHDWTKAGVMMRNTLNSDSEYAAVVITPTKRVCLQYRPVAGRNALSIHTDPNAVTLPHWVRLVRKGNTFTAQHSYDGLSWKDLQGNDSLTPGAKTWPAVVEIPMNEAVYVGLAVTSHAGPLSAEAKMSAVVVTGNVSPAGDFIWSEDIGFQMIMLPKK